MEQTKTKQNSEKEDTSSYFELELGGKLTAIQNADVCKRPVYVWPLYIFIDL